MASRRSLEIVTAALTGAFGTAILAGSVQIGVGWTPRGLGAGSFPAIAGALIVAGSLYNLALGALRPGPAVLDAKRVRRIALAFLPAVAFVAAIPFTGLHVAAAVYVFGMVAAQRKAPLHTALAIAVATPLALYGIFDWGFQVALPRGMLGAALGY
jgi:hypothetical protein